MLHWRRIFPDNAKNSLETYGSKACFFALSSKIHIARRWFSGVEKIFKKILKKVLRGKKKCVLLHPQSTENGGCEFFESNEPIKSSLKGKEPKIPKRLDNRWIRQVEQKNKIRTTIYNEEFDPGSGWTLAAGLIHASRTVSAPSGVWEWRTGA